MSTSPVYRSAALFLCFLGGVLAAQQPASDPASPATSTTPGQVPDASAGQSKTTPGTPAQSPGAPSSIPRSAPTAANTLHVNARLVILDAVVLDAKNNVVTDIPRDQFQIQEDGVQQTMLNFSAPGRYTPPPDVTIDSTADLDRLAPRAPVNIILLDEFNTRFEDMAFARYSLQKWLKGQPDKLNTPTMLVAVSLDKFQVLRDYTQNKEEILNALDHHFAAYPWQVHNFSWIAERYNTAFLTLRRVAEATTGHLGHKNMIWIGRGLPNVSVRLDSIDRDRVFTYIQLAVNELRDARVTLYTIDPAGVMTDPGAYGEEAALYEPFGGETNFKGLATATGGRNLFGRNDVDAEINTSIRDGSSIYMMTYRPTNAQRDIRHFRKISVTVAGRPDLKVVTRPGYFDSWAPARMTADGQMTRRLMSEVAAADTSTMVYDAVSLTVTPAAEANKYTLHLNARNLAWTPSDGTTPRQTKLLVLVSTFDKKDHVLKTRGTTLTLAAKLTVPPRGTWDAPVTLPAEVPADAKAVRARFVVRVMATGRMGTADADLLHSTEAASGSSNPTPAQP